MISSKLFELKQINLITYCEKGKETFLNNLTTDELKFMIDSSILGLFGILEANKIKYSIQKENNSLGFILKAYEK